MKKLNTTFKNLKQFITVIYEIFYRPKKTFFRKLS